MARIIQRKSYLKTADKIQRAKDYRVTGYREFIDPFPLGFGTLPEKIVYAALSRRGIPFYYLNDINIVFPEIDFQQTFQADFIIPSLKIIIEVQGAHWHSMPATQAADAFKLAVYEQAGYKALAWWDFDILDNVNKLFLLTPELNAAGNGIVNSGSAELVPMARTKTDSSQGIRTVNQRRAQRLTYRKTAPRVRAGKAKTYGGYTTYGR